MKYSERKVATLYKEDFTQPFMETVGSNERYIDVLSIVYHSISY